MTLRCAHYYLQCLHTQSQVLVSIHDLVRPGSQCLIHNQFLKTHSQLWFNALISGLWQRNLHLLSLQMHQAACARAWTA